MIHAPKTMKINLVADDDRAVDGGADEGLDEDVKVGLSRGGGVAHGDSHVVETGEVLESDYDLDYGDCDGDRDDCGAAGNEDDAQVRAQGTLSPL